MKTIPVSYLFQRLPALRHPSYRLICIGRFPSVVGMGIHAVSQGLLVSELSNGSAGLIASVTLCMFLPTLLFAFEAGKVADRFPKRRTLIGCQLGSAASSLLLAGLCFAGTVVYWHVCAIAFSTGLMIVLDTPARDTYVAETVGRQSLQNSQALELGIRSGGLIVGSLIAGLMLLKLEYAWAFFVNGIAFIFQALLLARVRDSRRSVWNGERVRLRDLAGTVRSSPRLLALFILAFALYFFSTAYVPLLPAFAPLLGDNEKLILSWLYTSMGIGAFLGPVLVILAGRTAIPSKVIPIVMFGHPLFILIFSLSGTLTLSLVAVAAATLSGGATMALVRTSILELSPRSLRGRIMGLLTWIVSGWMPVGGFVVGWLADGLLGVGRAMAIFAGMALVICGICGVLLKRYSRDASVRPNMTTEPEVKI